MDKLSIRNEIKQKLLKISDPEKEWASGAICDVLSSIDEFKNAKKLFIYLSSPLEPDTDEIVGLSLMLERVVAVPKIRGDEMDAMIITPYTNFYVNKFGIKEPVSDKVLDDIDVAIVPLVAFDGLNRLGHGKGYYDKYLKQHDCFKIGVAFDCQEYKGIETTPLDIPLDMLVTEKRVISKDGEKENEYK